MAFRFDEELKKGTERAIDYLVPKDGSEDERRQARKVVLELIERYGPVVDTYPTWHPFLATHDEHSFPARLPNEACGYECLDHNLYLAHAFITCPYSEADAEKVIESVRRLPAHNDVYIEAESIGTKLYSVNATAVLVTCQWNKRLEENNLIPRSIAVPLMLEKEMQSRHHAEVAETWDSMKPYFLGRPCGSRSSLFVSQETGQAMKTIWNAVINTGMFGPIRF